MFSRRLSDAEYGKAQNLFPLSTDEQALLGVILRNTLLRAGRQEAVYKSNDGIGEMAMGVKLVKKGFVIDPLPRPDTSIVRVVHTDDFTRDMAESYARIITTALRGVVGPALAGQIVRVMKPNGHAWFCVLARIPSTKALLALYRALG